MKFLSFILVLLFITLGASAQDSVKMVNSSELAPGSFVTFYAPMAQYTITIQSENGIVSTIEIPTGVFLSVQATEKSNPDRTEKSSPKIYKGDVVIRTRRGDEVGKNESMAAWDMMQKSPFQLALEDVTVTIDRH